MVVVMNFLDGFDVFVIVFIVINISKDFGLSKIEFGMFVSVGLIGMVVGLMVLVLFVDKFGCCLILLFFVVFFVVGLVVFGFFIMFEIFVFLCIFIGLGVGGILVGINVIISEYLLKKWCSFVISVYVVGFGIGVMIGGIIVKLL